MDVAPGKDFKIATINMFKDLTEDINKSINENSEYVNSEIIRKILFKIKFCGTFLAVKWQYSVFPV